MNDFLTEKRNEIKARLDELKPLVEEAARLQSALDALDGATTSRGGGARQGRKRAGSGRPGRPKGSGTRSAEALDLVTKQPGITITEMAEKMGINHNYLYRVLPGLQQEGKVRKDGRGWYPQG